VITGLDNLDTRDAKELVAELLARRLGYVPEWSPSQNGIDAALVSITSRYWQAIIERLKQTPVKNKLAFFDTVGIRLIPAQAARAALVFKLADNATDSRIPANTRVAAPPPAGTNEQIVFETETATGLAVAKLQEVVSLWPGRDQYIDHSATFLAGQPFQLFQKKLLQDTPHHIYVAHDTMLTLAGAALVNLIFELRTSSSESLSIIWEYWDGKVWRQFKSMRPQCDDEDATGFDSTDGLRFSGQFLLTTDCAETSKVSVNGVEAFWIRGRLDETLPPTAAQVLPEVESLKLSTSIAQPLTIVLKREPNVANGDSNEQVLVTDESASPLKSVNVFDLEGVSTEPLQTTDNDGLVIFTDKSSGGTTIPADVEIRAGDFKAPVRLNQKPKGETAVVSMTASGLIPDKAFADAQSIDLTKPFFPLGGQPQPGSAFYFTNEEIFSKPGAALQVYVQLAVTAQDQLSDNQISGNISGFSKADPNVLSHTVSWEYWDGDEWIQVDKYTFVSPEVSPRDFSGVGLIDGLVVPSDMAALDVNGEEAKWMRVRLLSGTYGFRKTIGPAGSTFSFVVQQPPAVAKFLLGYTWQEGPVNPQYVLSYNDFRYEDNSEAAVLPGETFQPFKPVSDRTPTVYLGFDRKLPEDRIGILFDIQEDLQDTQGSVLLWQYFDGFSWEDLSVRDETRDLRFPGIVSFIGAEDSQQLARFGTGRHWLRARLKEDGPPVTATLDGIFLNAVHALQHQTILNEVLGTATGQSNQTLTFTQIPVLDGELIEVREVSGLRANVEWRIVALEILGSTAAVDELESSLAGEGTQTEVIQGAVRLTRDRFKRVTEVWVRWQWRRHLLFSSADDRHYVIDRAQGLLLFGDGKNGKVPAAGSTVLARQYRTGGGSAGNVEAKRITQVLAPAGGIEEAFNPLPANGGADGESPKQYETRAPQSLRHRGRALLPADYEVFAREASPAVGFARAIPGRAQSGRRVPGSITLVIIARSNEPQPIPSFELREFVRVYIEEHAPADLAASHKLFVTSPDYLPIDVDTTVVPIDVDESGLVGQRVKERLLAFFHPLTGGPDGVGWDMGRDVYLSDVASILERVAGVDHLNDLSLLLDSQLQGESVRVRDDRIVAAGQFRINVVADR
jgi:uncharacterized phage protein gp47/JayE